MIKATELRIGNILYCGVDEDSDGNEIPMPGRILQIFEDGYHWTNVLNQHTLIDGYNSGNGYEFIEGIPLTANVLDKLGFVTADYEVDVIVWDYKDRFMISQNGVPPERQPFVFEWDNGSDVHETEIKYVHQLQNLYYALTGEELEIKNL